MSSFGPYAGAKTHSPSVDSRAKCPTVPPHRELMIGTHAAGQGSK